LCAIFASADGRVISASCSGAGILDVAHRNPARKHLDRQLIKRLRVALQMLADTANPNG
jgi:hypothetical protein